MEALLSRGVRAWCDAQLVYNRAVRCTRIAAAAALLCGFAAAEDRLNILNVVALDRQGQPVTDLQRADFQLQEDGKSRNIAFFRFTGDQPLQPKKSGEGLAPGEYSNRSGVPSHITVVLIDLLSDRFLSGSVISDDVIRAFKNLESSDGLYLYFLTSGGELYPIHPLPQPGAEVTPGGEPWTKNLAPMLQAALKKLVGIKPVDDLDNKVRFDMTMHALKEIGSQMELISGRKNLVWVTHGVPLNGASISEHGIVDFTVPLRVVCELLERVQIVVYPVEQSMNGVAAPLNTESSQTLEEVSGLTGGRKYSSGRVGDAVQQATTDSRSNYAIAFYSAAAEKPDGKHHKLRVTCTRKDVRLQTVPGFYSLLASRKPGDDERMTLEIALRSPFEATDIGLRASASPDPDTAQKMRFDMRIDPADLLLSQAQDHRTGKISFLFAPYGPSGLEQPAAPVTLNVSLTPEQYETATRDGIVVRHSIAVGAAVRKVRVIVVDGELGAAGSVTVPIQR